MRNSMSVAFTQARVSAQSSFQCSVLNFLSLLSVV
jgi:hypothetical protein